MTNFNNTGFRLYKKTDFGGLYLGMKQDRRVAGARLVDTQTGVVEPDGDQVYCGMRITLNENVAINLGLEEVREADHTETSSAMVVQYTITKHF